MENTPKVEEIRKIIKKLTGKKQKIAKICTESSNKEKLKESLKPYASALTNGEIEKLCSFSTSIQKFLIANLHLLLGEKEVPTLIASLTFPDP